MKRLVALLILIVLVNSAYAINIKQEPKQVPTFSILEMFKVNKSKKIKIYIVPVLDENIIVSGVGFKLIFNHISPTELK